MKSDPFYVQDSLSSQFDNEDKIRQQKKLDFMEQQKKDYLEYLKLKDNKKAGTPFKITEDANFHPPIKKLDNQDANLCTNIAKDNQYSRAGYQVNQWKIPDKYEKNFNENYIRGKNRSGYNIINHQIYDVKPDNKRMNPSLRDELAQYEKNVRNQFENLNLGENKSYKDYKDYQANKYINDINTRNNIMNKEYQSKPQVLNENSINNEQYQNYQRQENYIRNQNNNNINSRPIYEKEPINQKQENINPKPPSQNEDIEYKNYLEYIKRKELLEKEKEYEDYLLQKQQRLQEEQDREREREIYLIFITL